MPPNANKPLFICPARAHTQSPHPRVSIHSRVRNHRLFEGTVYVDVFLCMMPTCTDRQKHTQTKTHTQTQTQTQTQTLSFIALMFNAFIELALFCGWKEEQTLTLFVCVYVRMDG
jgi:hypothetical protein